MNHKSLVLALVCASVLLIVAVAQIDAQGPSPRAPRAPSSNVGTVFTYQGQLKDNGSAANGAYDFEFALFDSCCFTTQIGSTISVNDLTVTNGYFTAQLNFGADIMNGQARHLEIRVRPGASSGAYTTLAPRQALTPVPYALALPGLYTQQNITSPNLIGGSSYNTISPTVVGGTIGGGGFVFTHPNQVWERFGTVSGGADNLASGIGSVVAGGGVWSAGGLGLNIEGNTATGQASVVGGGIGNLASGNFSTVPGGRNNSAIMDYAFAAGKQAKANHQGTFVWGDSSNSTTTSTKDNQFLIRATNGVSLAVNAGPSKVIDLGERYRDNAIVAWASVGANGTISTDFGVDSITKSTGIYTVTLSTQTQTAISLVPIALAEVESLPTSAANARLVTINQINTTQFAVYITNGSYALVDNDFLFIVTGR